jgi:hypothetical protein
MSQRFPEKVACKARVQNHKSTSSAAYNKEWPDTPLFSLLKGLDGPHLSFQYEVFTLGQNTLYLSKAKVPVSYFPMIGITSPLNIHDLPH